jgi:hypothetical protein
MASGFLFSNIRQLPTRSNVIQTLVGSWAVRHGCQDADVGHPTHLTFDWGHNVQYNQVKNDGNKGGCARERVNLPKGEFGLNLKEQVGEHRVLLQTHIVHR